MSFAVRIIDFGGVVQAEVAHDPPQSGPSRYALQALPAVRLPSFFAYDWSVSMLRHYINNVLMYL